MPFGQSGSRQKSRNALPKINVRINHPMMALRLPN
jgi:hypothetical protein